jgi:hypothetical protein
MDQHSMEIVIYKPSARKHFSHMSALFRAGATKERVPHLRECAANTSSRIEVCTIYFETKIMSDLSYILCEQMALVHALAKESIELVAIYLYSSEIFNIQIGQPDLTILQPDIYNGSA